MPTVTEPRHVLRMADLSPDELERLCPDELQLGRGEEVDGAVIDGPQSAVWQQAANNRLPTEQALIYALITGDWDGST